ncbi:MAG: hypothetical protein NTY07_19995 [Bacteroidia bacterium]|nr:hypothetical protein [Bacteroidia bacterium]
MKRIILLISFWGVLIAQTQIKAQTHMITINPFGPDTVIKSVKYGERVKFKILNVNTFKVNGFVTSKPVNIDFDVPTIVINLAKQDEILGKKDELPKDAKGARTDSSNNFIHLAAATKTIAEMQIEFKTKFTEFKNEYYMINAYTSLKDNLYLKLSDAVFIPNIETLKKDCTSEYVVLYGSKKDLEADKLKVITDLNEINNNYILLKSLYEELQNMQKDASFIMSGTLQTTDKKNSLNVKNAEVKLETKKYFEDEYSFAKKVYDQLNDENNRQTLIRKAYDGIVLYYKIQNESFEVYTDSEPVNADEVTLTPILKYKDDKVAKEFSPYHIRTIGGVKVNFSSGYLLSFVGDDNYTIYKDSNGNIGASKGNSNKLTHGLGALAHVYCRSDKDYNWALSTGISLANNSNLSFYFGGSFMFTEKNRIVISSGISLNQVQRLNTYNLQAGTGDKYTFLSASDNTIKYDQVYRPAVFISVTYNLSGNK